MVDTKIQDTTISLGEDQDVTFNFTAAAAAGNPQEFAQGLDANFKHLAEAQQRTTKSLDEGVAKLRTEASESNDAVVSICKKLERQFILQAQQKRQLNSYAHQTADEHLVQRGRFKGLSVGNMFLWEQIVRQAATSNQATMPSSIAENIRNYHSTHFGETGWKQALESVGSYQEFSVQASGEVAGSQGVVTDDLDDAGAPGGIVPKTLMDRIWYERTVMTKLFRLFAEEPFTGSGTEVILPHGIANIGWFPLSKLTTPVTKSIEASSQKVVWHELGGRILYDRQVTMDVMINWNAEVLQKIMEVWEIISDSLVINADPATGAGLNINKFGGSNTLNAEAFAEGYLLYGATGLIKTALADTNRNLNFNGRIFGDTYDSYTNMNKLREMAGRFGIDEMSNCVFITNYATYLEMLLAKDVLTKERYGEQATIVTGELGKIFDIPIMATEMMSKSNATGQVSGTPAENTKGRILLVHRPSFRHLLRRSIDIQSRYEPHLRGYQMVYSVLRNFITRLSDQTNFTGYVPGDTPQPVVMGYNIT